MSRVRTYPEVEEVKPGDVVLARFGKHHYWPALVTEVSAGVTSQRVTLVFFGDHKSSNVSHGGAAKTVIRPFGDLDRLTSRERPATDVYKAALDEANRWQASLDSQDGAVLREAVAKGHWANEEPPEAEADWQINGAAIPQHLMQRAAALKLPNAAQPTMPNRVSPPATFRVLPPTMAPPPPALHPPTARKAASARGSTTGSTAAVAGSHSADGEHNVASAGAGDDEEEVEESSCDSRYERLHAPLEQLEYNGFAAHPMIGHHLHGDGADGPPPLVHSDGSECGGSGRSGGGGRGGASSGAGSSLVGRSVSVPAVAFPMGLQPGMRSAAALLSTYFHGVVTAAKKQKTAPRDVLEVYFATDHSTCLFSLAQAQQWLVPEPANAASRSSGGGSGSGGAGSSKWRGGSSGGARKRKQQQQPQQPQQQARSDAERDERRRVRVRLAGVSPRRVVVPMTAEELSGQAAAMGGGGAAAANTSSCSNDAARGSSKRAASHESSPQPSPRASPRRHQQHQQPSIGERMTSILEDLMQSLPLVASPPKGEA